MRKILLAQIILLSAMYSCFGASDPPKREFRGTWIATVDNIDWPKTTIVPDQKKRLIDMLDELKRDGINIVMFQIRPECDALYPSDLEPWSFWISGKQGTPPSPYYDPLQFALDEAHKRGMELHAWFNPYRAERSVGGYPLDDEHVINKYPDWILDFDALKIMDPGLPMVRAHVTSVIMDVVNRYDIDGIHFDDYFYPYPPNQIGYEDLDTYKNYKHGDASDNNIGDWRRENVNILMRMIHDSIQVVKPWVKFGISPFGIYKNGVPEGITGMDAYNVIYADPLAWLNERVIDYLTPQLYWAIGGNQDFIKLSDWWGEQIAPRGRHFYPGSIFRSEYSKFELPNQLKVTRSNENAQGNVYFSAKHFGNNTKGFRDELVTDYYRHIALLPVMSWKDSIAPNVPLNLAYDALYEGGPFALQWDLPATAADGDSAYRYVVYRFGDSPQPEDIQEPKYIADIAGARYNKPPVPNTTGTPYYYLVTALDRNYNESGISNLITVSPPTPPALAYPADLAINQRDTNYLTWKWGSEASSFYLQIAGDAEFNNIVLSESGIEDTFKVVTGLNGLDTYHWQVSAENAGGTSELSQSFAFTTGFPVQPLLASPLDGAVEIAIDTVLAWHPADSADQYRVQLNRSPDFTDEYMVIDTVLYGDTSLVVNDLEYFDRKFYYWKVRAANEYGKSAWSDTWFFKTATETYLADNEFIPIEYDLDQNYPNPFNPTTTIGYSVAETGFTTIKVFDMLGREVTTLVNGEKQTGNYSVKFDASNLAAGIYIYRIVSGNYTDSKKMVVIK